LRFDAQLSSTQRKEIHAVCESMTGLESFSHGYGLVRSVSVSKPELLLDRAGNAAYECLVERGGCLYLEGPIVDAAAQRAHSIVPDPAYLKKRAERDGLHHHITILHSSHMDKIRNEHPDFKNMSPETAIKRMIDTMAVRVQNNWRPVSVGCITESDGNSVYFVIVDWDSMQTLRTQYLKLDAADFHITFGFKSKDVHGPNVQKNRSTSLPVDKQPAIM
jgi:hypothetical protein